MIKILGVPGSLRADSSSNLILKVIASMIPKHVSFEIYDGIGSLPHFNDAKDVPDSVIYFRNKVKESDGVLICTPEYAFGVPGSLKNALDWTVGSGEFFDKPVSLVTASSQGEKGHAALLLILEAISAKVINNGTLLIPSVRAKLDPSGNVKDQATITNLHKVIEALVQIIDK
ncbi:NADPH-dependent oxidoreductase [Chryseotalea sanaruensis]|uniref:NADPH-dependent oxidoreductase n=1 Tax=Chryseotalea sanaruensis TaxID=2482724 RepID=A0A401UCW1_9BACT|nr:NAD(P)H-dependent oxidoreductase [Chryseotalea sanaruensis]GCC52710.1 NADPH-dependent oxidoreductase [Chryseotalea sanaruensis]